MKDAKTGESKEKSNLRFLFFESWSFRDQIVLVPNCPGPNCLSTELSGAELSGAKLSGAKLSGTIWPQTNRKGSRRPRTFTIILNRSSERIFNQSRYIGVVDLLRRNEDVIDIIVHH